VKGAGERLSLLLESRSQADSPARCWECECFEAVEALPLGEW